MHLKGWEEQKGLFQTFTSADGWYIVTLCVINATSTKMSYFCGPYIGFKSETNY